MNDLQLERLWMVHQGTDGFEMHPWIEALPLGRLDALRGLLRAGTGRGRQRRRAESQGTTEIP